MKSSNERLFLILIVLIAFIFRFQNIASIPPGLYPDEAINGNDALKAIDSGNFKVFYKDNNGREGLFINIQSLFLRFFEPKPWVLRLPSAIIGLLTVIGIYLLARLLFNWQIAAISSFYLATSFWHTNFSRIGFRAILVPFVLVFGFYFLWRGFQKLNLKDFALSGIFFGLGFHTYIAFRFVPLLVILTLLAYWLKIEKDYTHSQYIHLRNSLIKGFALLFLVAFFVSLPILLYFYKNPSDFLSRQSQVSVFFSENPFKEFFLSLGKTLISFNFVGDFNWRHNFSGSPLLLWPVGVFFLAGLIRNFIKLFKKWKNHRHPGTLEVMLLSWFFVMILPASLTREGIPHALRTIGVIPIAMIFAGQGTWWLFENLIHWYREKDFLLKETAYQKEKEAYSIVGLVLIIFLIAVGISEYNKYFNQWAKRKEVEDAFLKDFVDLGNEINRLPKNLEKYIIVNAKGVLVDGVPMPAQTVMFITKSYTKKLQREKKIFYLLPEELNKSDIFKNKNAVIFNLPP